METVLTRSLLFSHQDVALLQVSVTSFLAALFCSDALSLSLYSTRSAFYHMYSRVYGVVTFPTKYDAQGSLVRKCTSSASQPDSSAS